MSEIAKLYKNAGVEYDYEYFINNYRIEWFAEKFAGLINNLWQDLTESEREQIAEILRG